MDVEMDVEVVVGGLQQDHRAADLSPGGTVRFVVVTVDAGAGPVVLAHAVHDGRVAQRRPDVGMVAFAHRRWFGGLVPGVRVGADHLLGRWPGSVCRTRTVTSSTVICSSRKPSNIVSF
jgi:hypothetical protein